jgi:carboxymethylenebutenolidase
MDIQVRAADGGSFSAYLAPSKAGRSPAIVVIQEIFGVNKVMRDVCDWVAAQGYTAICPDLFWRQEPGIQITDKTEAEWKRAFELFQGFDVAKGVDDLKATLATIRGHELCSGRAGAVGFCLGGKLAYLMATRTDVDASVGYYGVGIENDLGEAGNIKKPLLLHVAEKDKFVPPEAQKTVRETLERNPQVTIYNYPNCDHAFARVGGEHYDRQAADAANRRTLDFFQMNLKV